MHLLIMWSIIIIIIIIIIILLPESFSKQR